MFDIIKSVFRHPIFEKNRSTGETLLPVATNRPIRFFAQDGQETAYREWRCGVYDFSVLGGAVAEIALPTAPVYSGEIIVDGLIVGVTTCDSAGDAATIAVGVSGAGAADSLKAAANDDTYAAGAVLPIIPLGHGTGEVAVTEDGTLTITVAAEALTAGKFYIFYEVVKAA